MSDTPTHDVTLGAYHSAIARAANSLTASPQAGNITEALEHLRYANSELEETIERLENRLSSLLLPQGPSDPSPAAGSPNHTPTSAVAEGTHGEAARLERQISRLRDIIGRIDV